MAYRTAVALALALATASGLAAQSTSTTEKTAPTEGKQMQSGLQVSGTVISSDANRLIVKADNGQQMTFIVNESTADPRLFNIGDRVTASYVTLAGTGPVVTKVISSPVEARTSTGTVAYEQKPAATAAVKTPVASATATVTTPAPVATTTTTIDNDTVADIDDDDDADVLPATASPLPLIALAGFVAGGAARVIRRFRK